jgi:trans-2,3-dihydro-3-hydroxyanthranilate isomerase
MEQPLPSVRAYERTAELLDVLGLAGSTLPVDAYTNGPTHVMVGVADVAALRGLAPDLGALARLGPLGIDCFAVSDPRAGTPAGVPAAVRSRVFCPGLGVPEDPATGSAAGPLAWHLARHGWCGSGTPVRITQGVELERPSQLEARVEGPVERPERIIVGGAAVVVAAGSFRTA